jgi:hypothetical protein
MKPCSPRGWLIFCGSGKGPPQHLECHPFCPVRLDMLEKSQFLSSQSCGLRPGLSILDNGHKHSDLDEQVFWIANLFHMHTREPEGTGWKQQKWLRCHRMRGYILLSKTHPEVMKGNPPCHCQGSSTASLYSRVGKGRMPRRYVLPLRCL